MFYSVLQVNLPNCYYSEFSYHKGNTILHTQDTVKCRYNAVQHCEILHKWLQELRQNINQMLDPQQTPHTLP